VPSDETIDAAERRAQTASREGAHGTPYSTRSKFGDGHQAPKSASFDISKLKDAQAGSEKGAVATFREQVTSMKRRAFSGDESVDWQKAFGALFAFIVIHWILNLRMPPPPSRKPHVELPPIDDDDVAATATGANTKG